MTALLAKAELPLLASRRKMARLKFFHELFNGKLNLRPELYLQIPTRVSPRINHPYAVLPYSPRVDIFKHSFLVKTIVDWNNLDPRVFVEPNTTDSFVKHLEIFLK